MNLVYVTASLPFGPSETFIIPEVRELIRQGHRVRVVPVWGRGPISHQDAAELLPVMFAPRLVAMSLVARALATALRHPGLSIACVIMLTQGKPRLWLKNFLVLPKALWLAHAAREWRIDHVHACWASTPATLAMLASRLAGIPWSFTAYRWDIIENNLLHTKIVRASFARFISDDGVRLARESGPGQAVPPGKMAVIFSGVAIPPLETLRPPNRRSKLVALCPAALIERKGHRFLFEALARLKTAGLALEVQLAGTGVLEAALRRRCEELGLADDVRFLGQVSHDELLSCYCDGRIDLVVLPSLHEGMSVALIEALAHALPVIATPVGGNPQLLGDGAGLMVPAENSTALATALETLLLDPTERQRLATAGRRRVEALYSVEQTVGALLARFEATIPRTSSSAAP